MRGRRGFDFFVRQLRDMKTSIPLEGVSPGMPMPIRPSGIMQPLVRAVQEGRLEALEEEDL